MQKSKIIRSISILLITATLIIGGIFNINVVHADTVNYGIPPMNDYTEYPLFQSGNQYRWIRRTPNQSSKGYAIVIKATNSSYAYVYLFNDEQEAYIDVGGQSASNYPNGSITWSSFWFSSNHNANASRHIYNDITFYGIQCNGWSMSSPIAPYLEVSNLPSTAEEWYNAYVAAMTQTSPIDTGSILNLSLSTRYVTEQRNNSSENLDVITWNGRQDSNLNDLTGLEWFVDIRARKISYSGNSVTDLLSRTQNEAVFTDDYFNIISVSANKGNYELTWGDVYNLMDISAYQILPSESLFYTYGWVYQIRLRNADTEDVSEWQTVYTLSSLPPQDTQDFSNNLGFNAQATEIIYKVDTQNLNTNTTYVVNYNYYNDIPIGSDDYQQDVNGKPWYVILLEAITSMINTLIETVGGVFGDVINSILNFIKGVGVDVLDVFTNIFNGFSDNVDLFDTQIDNFTPNPDVEINDLKGILEIPFNILRSTGLAIIFLVPISLMILRLILV